MSNILFISHRDNFPYTDGGKVASFFGMTALAKHHNLVYAYLTELSEEESLKKYEQFNFKICPFQKNTADNYWNYPKTLFSPLSFKFNKFYDKKMLSKLKQVVAENNIDTVFCSQAQISKYATELKKDYPNLKICLWEHNIEYKLVKQYAQNASNIFMKLFAYWEYLKTKMYEINVWKAFDTVFFISDIDLKTAQKYNKSFDKNNVIYTPVNQQETSENIKIENNSFIFCGSLKSYQNKLNLINFINDIWKKFIVVCPSAKLYITGNKKDFLLQRLGLTEEDLSKLNIINLGFVDNLEKVIQSKKYYVSPTCCGSGIRIKVLEALSLKQTVFLSDIDYNMTTLFEDMKNIVHFSCYEDFLNKYKQLEDNPMLYNQIKENGNRLFSDYFTEEHFYERINQKLKSI